MIKTVTLNNNHSYNNSQNNSISSNTQQLEHNEKEINVGKGDEKRQEGNIITSNSEMKLQLLNANSLGHNSYSSNNVQPNITNIPGILTIQQGQGQQGKNSQSSKNQPQVLNMKPNENSKTLSILLL